MPFQLPGPTQRTAIMGRTGSGKTQFGCFLLSLSDWPRRPWIVINGKRDELLDAIHCAVPYKFGAKLPRHPGIYMVHPRPDEEDKTEALLWAIWHREGMGIFVDEGYMLPNSGPHGRGAFQSLLTQGRSKHIPMIVLTQRPAWVSRFLFTEADFHSVFQLTHSDDRSTVEKFVPRDLSRSLPAFHSYWHAVSEAKVYTMLPAPDRATILQRFEDRSRELRERQQWTKYIWPGQSRTGLRLS
jgi:hypothetical protein